jgi:hypothetical protein
MKQLFYLLIISLLITSCGSNQTNIPQSLSELEKIKSDTSNFTQILWVDSIMDFGTIKEGEVIEVKFRFKNIGNKPLYVINVQAGCGCTSPDYSKEAIAPNKEGWVKGVFNSLNQAGAVNKQIKVTTNTKNFSEHFIYFTGTVN